MNLAFITVILKTRQPMQFRHKTSEVQASATKVMLTVFYDSKGVTHTEYIKK